MSTSISDQGFQTASGNIVDLRVSMPSTGSYTAGDVVIEKNTTTLLTGWKRVTTGSSHVLGTDWVYFANGSQALQQATTSGAVVALTGIPSWARTIQVGFFGCSTTGTSQKILRLGNTGGVFASGYVCQSTFLGAASMGTQAFSDGFQFYNLVTAADQMCGCLTLTATNGLGTEWAISGTVANISGTIQCTLSGVIALGQVLERIQLTTVGATDTWDNGYITARCYP